METAFKYLIPLGFGLVVVTQIVGVILVFGKSIGKGLLSVVVPGYFIFALRREGLYWKVVGAWHLGILFIVAGTLVYS